MAPIRLKSNNDSSLQHPYTTNESLAGRTLPINESNTRRNFTMNESNSRRTFTINESNTRKKYPNTANITQREDESNSWEENNVNPSNLIPFAKNGNYNSAAIKTQPPIIAKANNTLEVTEVSTVIHHRQNSQWKTKEMQNLFDEEEFQGKIKNKLDLIKRNFNYTFKEFNDTFEKIAELFENEAANIAKLQEQEVEKLLSKIRDELNQRHLLLLQKQSMQNGLAETYNSTSDNNFYN